MSLDAPQTTPASSWLSAFLALGRHDGTSWTPLGAGVLVLDSPIVWLVTTRKVLDAVPEGQALAGFVRRQDGMTLVDMTTGRSPSDPLPWLAHQRLDLAAAIFPVDPAWQVKAFSETLCLRSADLEPLQRAAILSVPYGLGENQPGQLPLVLDGSVARVDRQAQQVLTSAPLLPTNAGAPLVVELPAQAGGGAALAGITTHTLAVPEGHRSAAAPVRLSAAIAVDAVLDLIRGDAAKAQRKAAVAVGKP